jgi:hypothetical protein
MRRRTLSLLVLAAPLTLTAQSDVGFPKEVYAGRRARLAAQIPGAVAIVPGRRLPGDIGSGRQDSNF